MTADKETVDAFIARWAPSGGGERSNCQSFLTELCDLLGVGRPDPAVEDESRNAYVYERKVRARRIDGPTTANFIDLYKRGCFVLEAKQSRKRQKQLEELKQQGFGFPEIRTGSGRRGGAQWDTLMRSAREQAENYAKRLPPEEGWPPFLVIVDIGHVIELYADFSLQGKYYAQFPDRGSYRIALEDLRDDAIRERLRLLWENPQELNPARRTAEITRDVAELLAKLSRSLETRLTNRLPDDLPPEQMGSARRAIAEKVASFLMRCLFTMFAEDVGLLPRNSFTGLLRDYRNTADKLHIALPELWRKMNKGGYLPLLHEDILKFNGGLFRDATAMEISEDDLVLLTLAAERDWKDVEPAIFGTLLERALDPRERHSLGAHYTPRAYVERLVAATIIEPLTRDWRDVETAAAQLIDAEQAEAARDLVRDFHREFCELRILDPACGTGNFLYVALELMKRLEGEIIETLFGLGETQETLELDRHTVDPHQFLGLEINPRAVVIAELVLWIGYLQWHFRTRGRTMPAAPVLKNFGNIREQDAILTYDKSELLRDESGSLVTRWDGITYKTHPNTGEQIPDENAGKKEIRTYLNPRAANWPKADFIVGNPPFIGGKDMRRELGDGYAEACWAARRKIPGGADFVMHFWDKAAATVRAGDARRFGLITTNSITQTFSRRVIENHMTGKKPLSLAMAIPDHPWMKSADRAAVRIAMTVGVAGDVEGVLRSVVAESGLDTDSPEIELAESMGKIGANLTTGPDVTKAMSLRANEKLSSPGVKLHGAGFIVTPEQAAGLGLGRVEGLDRHILPYRNGRDLAARPRGVMVIDLFGLTAEQVRERFPAVYQWVADRVKPDRDQNNRKTYRDNWWIFGEPRRELRPALKNLPRYITTVETAKHRFFQFLDASIRPDNMLVNFGLDDAWFLGVLSSRIHVTWALAAGGRLGVGNDPRYNKTRCFDPFPFPDANDEAKERIRGLGEQLDAHRKSVLEQHRQLTMTGLYNVLEKMRGGVGLDDGEKDIYEAGLVGVLREIHNDLDRAVADAYGWPAEAPDEEILERLVALNKERAEEEAKGQIRWLRPEFQAPDADREIQIPTQIEAPLVIGGGKAKKPRLPARLPDQVAAVRATLVRLDDIVTAEEVARQFSQGRRVQGKIEDVLRTLTLLGQAEQVEDAYFLSG